jgi:spore coat protein A
MDSPTEVYGNGKTVVRDIYNNTADTQPYALPPVNLQVIGKAKFNKVGTPDAALSPPEPNYRGWRETVRMNPGEVTRVITKFTPPSVPFVVPPNPWTGRNQYVWHCPSREHEEHDMMRPLVING